jgi:thioredoxin-like negative regulator of GroEL
MNLIHMLFQVTALPTVIAFRHGKPIEQFVGAQPAAAVQEWIRRLSS